jgi:hypothetical protein
MILNVFTQYCLSVSSRIEDTNGLSLQNLFRTLRIVFNFEENKLIAYAVRYFNVSLLKILL